ncbi:ABC-F family ATP-binding cassette domain-containing protein [Psittacicella melopsittaci]|nr:ATP-binding cassette domain-containing protein [Psittacicella melopsittaci]
MNIWVGKRELLHSLNFTINPGTKVALCGANGTGKTTLMNTFKLDAQERKMQFGNSLEIAPVRIAWVEQEVPNTEQQALEYVIEGDFAYKHWQEQLNQALANNDHELIAQANAKLDEIDAWTIRSRAAVILDGLGFSQEQQQQAVNQLSGGWRIRLNLARALLVASDLLLLDEPTNHLDIDAVYWLEDYLSKRYQGTIVFISHDQEFMDNLADHVLYIEQQTITAYTGNYSEFIKQRALNREIQQKQYLNQQKHIKKVQEFIERFRYKARKASQAQSRIRYLEKLEIIDPVVTQNPFEFNFLASKRLPTVIATIRKANIGYISGQPVLKEVNFSITPGTRIGLLGLNGAGKSTLIKAFAGELTPLDGVGTIQINELVQMGYFNQYVVDKLDTNASPMELLTRLDPQILPQDARNFLGGFNFSGDKVFEKIEKFSGGEKSRLALALIVYQRPNLLLLDEPTNHLDLDMRQALATALQEFEGSLIVVSHDRFLLSAVVEDFYLVHDHKVEEFAGDLNDYYKWVLNYKAQKQQQAPEVSKASPKLEAGDPNLTPLERVLKDTRLARELKRLTLSKSQEQNRLLQQSDKLKARLQQIEQEFLDPEVMASAEKVTALAQENKQLQEQVEQLEEQWMELEMEIEEITQEFVAKQELAWQKN